VRPWRWLAPACAFALFAAAGHVAAQGAREAQLVQAAADALGGRDRIQAVKTLTIEGYATNPNIGQAMTPEADPLLWMLPDHKRSIDLQNQRMALQFTRRPAFPAVFDNAPQHQRLDGDVAFNIPAAGPGAPAAAPTRLSAAAALDRRIELLHHPLTAVRAAMDASARLSHLRDSNGQRSVDVTTAAGDSFTLTLDAQGRPRSVRTAVYHPNLGDTARTTTFSAYEDLDGVRLPKRLVTTLDRWVEYDLGVMKNTLDADLRALRAPNAVRQAAAPATPAPQNVTVTPLAKGIWFLTGGAIPNLVVEFADHVTIVEAGSEARLRVVLAKARELVPGKPVTQLVLSHHHFDHTGGLRAAVAEGLTIITHRVNEAWFREAVRRRHSIEPDALARSSRGIRIERVDDARTLKDAAMEMTLYHLAGSTHGDGILAAYFPRERIYAEADVWNPGAQLQPHVRSLMEDIERRRLQIDRVVPLHGQQVRAFAELQKDAQFWSGRRFTTTTYSPPR
jgi:glyoxylase-like metal-dependent hydrolase (beta-lactamase superfamily II)